MNTDKKLTIQLFLAVGVVIFGCILMMMGFWSVPIGEISSSVLAGVGELLTFAGSVMGLDYSYKAKIYIDRKNNISTYDAQRDDKNKNQPYEENQ